jgi:hypothetical protein
MPSRYQLNQEAIRAELEAGGSVAGASLAEPGHWLRIK